MKKTVQFSFEKVYKGSVKVTCNDSVDIPLCHPSNWLLSKLILDHDIPAFAEKDLSNALSDFLDKSHRSYVDDRLTDLYDNFLSNLNSPSQLSVALTKRVDERISKRFQSEPPTDEEIFGQTYTKIVRSPVAMDLIRLEHSFATAIEAEVVERNHVLTDLQKSILSSTEALLSRNNEEINVTDAISELQRQFHSDYEVEKMTWNSRISDLKETQRQDYRNFVMSIEEQMLRGDSSKPLPPTSSNTGHAGLAKTIQWRALNDSNRTGPRSESFMVQLGRQLRSFYNLKLVEADPMDLMMPIGFTNTSNSPLSFETTVNLAERLSSALAIYSNELTGLVILVDSQILHSKSQQRLAEVCELSTDFHFPELDRQLAEVQETVKKLGENGQPWPEAHPKAGDVYITRHSNLRASEIGGNAGGGGGVQVVFHVVTEEEGIGVDSASPALPPYLCTSISAALRVCSQHNISTLSVPLLFTRRPLESLTSIWCQRRAESVLKVVKSTLMESIGVQSDLRTVIFLLPPPPPSSTPMRTSDTTTRPKTDVFEALAAVITSIFQQTSAIVVDTAATGVV